jgi:hypothetical protein
MMNAEVKMKDSTQLAMPTIFNILHSAFCILHFS